MNWYSFLESVHLTTIQHFLCWRTDTFTQSVVFIQYETQSQNPNCAAFLFRRCVISWYVTVVRENIEGPIEWSCQKRDWTTWVMTSTLISSPMMTFLKYWAIRSQKNKLLRKKRLTHALCPPYKLTRLAWVFLLIWATDNTRECGQGEGEQSHIWDV